MAPSVLAMDVVPSHETENEDGERDMDAEVPQETETEEDRRKHDMYKIWKKNTPYLYDMVVTHSLEWPSLTVQWLPEYVRRDKTETHKVVLGTHTSGNEPNHVIVADVALPNSDIEIDGKGYNPDKGEVGGYGGTLAKIGEKVKMTHEGEVNRARVMPQNSFVIATKSPFSSIYVFDYRKHPSQPPPEPRPDHICLGHEAEGYGLNWSSLREGYLLSGSDDAKICLWDLSNGGAQVQALHTWTGHTSVVEDVDWHRFSPHLFGSVGDDKSFCLWDVRKASGDNKAVEVVKNAHNDDINCVQFNPLNEYLVATGGSDGHVNIWDVRNLRDKFHALSTHTEGVYQCAWSPHSEFCLASGSADTHICCWDLSRIGEEQTKEQSEVGPAELVFIHGGHTAKISDLHWNPNRPWTFASVAEDNIMQVWQMTEAHYITPTSGGSGEGGITDADLEG